MTTTSPARARIYLLRRPGGDIDAGQYAGHVIVARSAERALEIVLHAEDHTHAPVPRMDGTLSTAPLVLAEGAAAWQRAVVTPIGVADDPTEAVVCSDYTGDM